MSPQAKPEDALQQFVRQSNAIERIHRDPTPEEIEAHATFLAAEIVVDLDLERFVSVIQPGAVLRDREGLDVRVGSHIAPRGGPEIRNQLQLLLSYQEEFTPHAVHLKYETLHPFTDGNGRSGRALWLWMMRDQGLRMAPLGFLQTFYYQTLQGTRP